MSSGYEFRDLHTKRVLVKLQLGGAWVTVEGIAKYAPGELQIPTKDSKGDLTVVLREAEWKGEIAAAPDGNGFLIRLEGSIPH